MGFEPNQRGEYGTAASSEGKGGTAGILILLGIAAGIYGLSPGARHYYKHGRLPPHKP